MIYFDIKGFMVIVREIKRMKMLTKSNMRKDYGRGFYIAL